MNAWKSLSTITAAILCSAVVAAQDPVKTEPTHYTTLFENNDVRILKIKYAVGSKSAPHQHPDAIVVPLTASKVRFTMPDGKSEEREMTNESALYMPGGIHSPAKIGTSPVDAILVEFKSAAPGKAVLPASREGMVLKNLAEGPRAVAYRNTAAATFSEPAGTRHDYDQVVIALGSAQIALSIDGKPTRTSWARGDVQFIGRGVPHETKNNTGKPVDMVIVAIR